MIQFAVCDDEPAMQQALCAEIDAWMQEQNETAYHISCFCGGRALLESACDFDIVFLDIQMEQLNGMETAKMLRQRSASTVLIFVTVSKEYVFDAFEVTAYDYLLKPLNRERFQRTMNRVLARFNQAAPSIVVQKGTSCEVIPLAQIVYCEVQGRKIYIHQENGMVTDYYDRLEEFERRLDRRFFKCHRSYLVNLDKVRGCHAGQAALSDGSEIPVSRLRERQLTEALLRHMKETRGSYGCL